MAMTVFNGSQLLVMIGDGNDPEVFTHPCLINTERGIVFASDTTETTVPDCPAGDDPAWKTLDVDGLNATITGAGIANVDDIEDLYAWYISGQSKNVKVKINVAAGVTWTGAFKLTDFTPATAAGRKDKGTASLTLKSDGPVALAPNA